jgi:crotonobetaine/carnitine-CoA ligase
MTEIPGLLNNQISGKQKLGTMGVPALHPHRKLKPTGKFSELKIVNENEKEVKPGQEGELLVKTVLLMKGYYNNSEETVKAFTEDGWFKTGDIVKQDPDGFYVFVARKKDIIRCRGENISGAEIDRIAMTCEGVAEVAAIGVPSALGEEDILLAAVKRNNSDLTPEKIHKWFEKQSSKTKWPRYIIIVDSLPPTPTARVAKFKLKQISTELLKSATDFGKKN